MGEGKGREGKGGGKRGGFSLRARSLAAGIGGEGGVGWGSERPCSQARPGEGFAAQHNFFYFLLL